MSDDKAFKNLLNKHAAQELADRVGRVFPDFERTRFVSLASRSLGNLELTERVKQSSDALAACLPSDIPTSLQILTFSLDDPSEEVAPVSHAFVLWPISQFISEHGLSHFEESMTAMVALTKRFTSEFAVRPFLEREPERTFAYLQNLCSDPNQHVRRWCSEGTRPRLPWGKRLHALVKDPSPILPLLERLKDDPEVYVRRSIANNLNDIAKDHPDLVIELCTRWLVDASEERRWIVERALRSLIKQGSRDALALLGFGNPSGIVARLRIHPRSIVVGESVQLELELLSSSKKAQALMIDYVVHHVHADGSTSPKVFKWTKKQLAQQESLRLTKFHPMKRTTIRTLYTGKHRVEVQINGKRVVDGAFTLRTSR